MAFEAGDIVILKSGGQPMTVIAVDEGQADCIWTGEDGDLFRETIPTVALEEVEFEADDETEDEGSENGDEEEEDEDDEEAGKARAEKELSPA